MSNGLEHALEERMSARIDCQGMSPDRARLARSLVPLFARVAAEAVREEVRKAKAELNREKTRSEQR